MNEEKTTVGNVQGEDCYTVYWVQSSFSPTPKTMSGLPTTGQWGGGGGGGMVQDSPNSIIFLSFFDI